MNGLLSYTFRDLNRKKYPISVTASDFTRPLTVTLRDGATVLLRTVAPHDKQRLREGVAQLSGQSLYQRFFTSFVKLTDEQLRYLTEVDGVDHVAFGALDVGGEGQPGVGLARYVRLLEEPNVAEAAVAVVDAWQGRGLGSLLVAALGRCAAADGLTHFRGFILEENRGLLRYLNALGAATRHSEPGLMQVDLPLYTRPEDTPPTRAGRHFAEALRRLQGAAISPAQEPPVAARRGGGGER